MSDTALIKLWFDRAVPFPTTENQHTQMGCHAEEFREMLDCLDADGCGDALLLADLRYFVGVFADKLKSNKMQVRITDRKEFLDSLCDQIVTSVGVAHMYNMKPTEALRRVNTSNWSKFDKDGQPLFNAQGKIAKGPDYHKPDLEGLY